MRTPGLRTQYAVVVAPRVVFRLGLVRAAHLRLKPGEHAGRLRIGGQGRHPSRVHQQAERLWI